MDIDDVDERRDRGLAHISRGGHCTVSKILGTARLRLRRATEDASIKALRERYAHETMAEVHAWSLINEHFRNFAILLAERAGAGGVAPCWA